MPDRRVHAETEHVEIVRYEGAGHWYFESKDGKIRQRWSVDDAAKSAALWVADNIGRVHLNVPGGTTFERKVRGYREALRAKGSEASSCMRVVRVRCTFTVEVDVDAWEGEYGVSGVPEVQEDVQRHVENTVREHLRSLGVLRAEGSREASDD